MSAATSAGASLVLSISGLSRPGTCCALPPSLTINANSRTYFVSDRNLISPRQSFQAAVDFAASYTDVLQDNPEVNQVARQAIELLRGVNSQGLEAVTNDLEKAKYILMAPRGGRAASAKIAAIEAILPASI